MKYSEIFDILKTTGLPVAYDHFKTGQTPPLPFIVFDFPRSADFIADNRNYVPIAEMEVYLYTEQRDFAQEKLVEDVLSQYWVFEKESQYWEGENVQQTIYMTQVMVEYDPVSS